MNEYVTDTMALVLRLEKRRMGARARAVFEQAETEAIRLLVPGLVLAEILYLSEKGRIAIGLDEVAGYLARYGAVQEYPLDLAATRAAAEITDIPELHDRLIAGTARLVNGTLLTNDPLIQASAFVTTLW